MKGKAGSLLKRLCDQGSSTMAGKMMPAHPPPASVDASMARHAQDLGLNPRAQMGPRAWTRTVHGAVHGARAARLAALAQAGQQGGSLPGDAAYMASATPEGQVGAWAKLVPALSFGARVNFRRFRIGILEGYRCANVVWRRVPGRGRTPSVKMTMGVLPLEMPSLLE